MSTKPAVSLKFGIFHELEVRGRTQEVERGTFAKVLEQVCLAEELGFESSWFVEHHFTRGFSHSSAPDLLLAALSQRTQRIRLGLGVMLLPFAHPVQVAERVGTLDVLSGGRVEFGTGRGASPLEYQAFQRPFERYCFLSYPNTSRQLIPCNSITATCPFQPLRSARLPAVPRRLRRHVVYLLAFAPGRFFLTVRSTCSTSL